MYADELHLDEKGIRVADRRKALNEIEKWLQTYKVKKLFAYNASFDQKHLPEYAEYEWYDIMRLAAYRQYNKAIPDSADCFKTGRLKRGYGVENILKMLKKNNLYRETHNAVQDAKDELEIMRLLGHGLHEYEIARISAKGTVNTGLQQNKAEPFREAARNPGIIRGIMSRLFGNR